LRLYLDTSALVKLYVDEDGSSMVREWVNDAEAVATSILAFVEGRAAFARRRREKRILPAAHARLVRDLEADWSRYLVLEATEPVIRRAGRLTEIHSLRAYDAIHLASAKVLYGRNSPSRFPSHHGTRGSKLRRARKVWESLPLK
jgi:uncharacterized protein